MPRINADTVAEHVARQEAAVISAAAKLFGERGVEHVTLADIAAEVGLARSSIYRYFPDKAHLLVAWFQRDLAPLRDESDRIAAADEPAADRLAAWLGLHLEYLSVPEHRRLIEAMRSLPELSDEVQADIAEGHRQLYGSLGRIVSEALAAAGDGDRDPAVVAMLLAGTLTSAAELVASGHDATVVAAELTRAARAQIAPLPD